MKNRFGKICYTSSLTFGLYPLSGTSPEPDTRTVARVLEVTASDGLSVYDTINYGMPQILGASLTRIVVEQLAEESINYFMPTILSASLTQVLQLRTVNAEETINYSNPVLLSGSLDTVVIPHTVFDLDTRQHSTTLEISAS